MKKRNTVFILGAGASKEANLPTGAELKEKIARLLDFRFDGGIRMKSGDYEIYEALRKKTRETGADAADRDINVYLRAGRHISEAMPQAISIDNFIDVHSGDKRIEFVGKLAIVRSILVAERSSKLYFDITRGSSKQLISAMTDTWFNSFFQLLTENCKLEQLAERLELTTLISFNYDRCVEHFLFHSFQNYYGVNAFQAAELVGRIPIFHPYGTVGSLPWQKQPVQIEFGAEPSPAQLLDLARKIKTFTEGTDPSSSSITIIRKSMQEFNLLASAGDPPALPGWQ